MGMKEVGILKHPIIKHSLSLSMGDGKSQGQLCVCVRMCICVCVCVSGWISDHISLAVILTCTTGPPHHRA